MEHMCHGLLCAAAVSAVLLTNNMVRAHNMQAPAVECVWFALAFRSQRNHDACVTL